MIPAKIHQIYFNWHNKELEEIELFRKSVESVKEKNPDFEHKVWTEEECLNLVEKEFPEYKDFYLNFRYPIQKVDFIRWCILYTFGGIYMDLDMHCIKNFEPLRNNKILFHSIRHIVPDHSEFVINDLMASVPKYRLWKLILSKCVRNYKEKESIDVYDTWKGRFVLQTTGPKFISRCLKQYMPNYKPQNLIWTKWRNERYKNMPREDYFIECFRAGSWLKVTNKNLKNHDTFK